MGKSCGCTGDCGHCSGCCGGGSLSLTEPEVRMLQQLGQIPFLPVARRADSEVPVYLEEDAEDREQTSLVLQCLEKKGLISLDYDCPLSGASYCGYTGFPVHGSMALTARGQQVLELLELQGALEE